MANENLRYFGWKDKAGFWLRLLAIEAGKPGRQRFRADKQNAKAD
jgi:hypothetical protein